MNFKIFQIPFVYTIWDGLSIKTISRYCPFNLLLGVSEVRIYSGRKRFRPRQCAIGGFNVSNLMGTKRRMIDIGKKITFYFLQNVWKCTVCSHLHLKYAESAIMTQKNLFLKSINMVSKKQNFMLISNTLMPT
jgi:hypothetical protein